MSDDRKKLMPESLPKPATAHPSTSVRQRVLKHLNLLVAAGAATATLACQPYAVVDPLPPPARCRTTGSVLDALEVSALTDASGVAVRIQNHDYSGDVRLLRVTEVTGARVDSAALDSAPAVIHLTPDHPASIITLKLATECAGTSATTIRIVLQPVGGDAGMGEYSVTTSDESSGP
jgi:hypothetical protein